MQNLMCVMDDILPSSSRQVEESEPEGGEEDDEAADHEADEDEFELKDDPYAWENEVPNPDRIPGGPHHHPSSMHGGLHPGGGHDQMNHAPAAVPSNPWPRVKPFAEEGGPTRFDMLREEVLAHGARAPSRLLNDFPVQFERVATDNGAADGGQQRQQ
jgi:hypothetical protein